jgi:hypothetical protein
VWTDCPFSSVVASSSGMSLPQITHFGCGVDMAGRSISNRTPSGKPPRGQCYRCAEVSSRETLASRSPIILVRASVIWSNLIGPNIDCVAEREGFEPSIQVLARITV